MLFEFLQGEVLTGGWKDEQVKEALELCLACKACKGECPVNVDIATYKAEFLSHYYEDRRRPLRAYAFGWIDKWARLASLAPRLSNALVNAPGVNRAAKLLLNIPAPRRFPSFASETFRSWALAHGVPVARQGVP